MGGQHGLASERRPPQPIEVVDAKPCLSPAEECRMLLSRYLAASDPAARPILYSLSGDRWRLTSDAPFAIDPHGDRTLRGEWSLARPVPVDDPLPAPDRTALVSLPGMAHGCQVADLVAARLTAVLGAPAAKAQLVASIRRQLAAGEPSLVVLATGGLAQSFGRPDVSLREACRALSVTDLPAVVFVVPGDVERPDFERLLESARRHGATGIVAGAAHPDARLVLVAGEQDRGRAFLRAPGDPPSLGAVTSPGISAGVEVAVLGPVEVRGSAEPLGGHPLLSELIVYLAMHKEGVSTSTWETALWPERRMPAQTIANRLSEARRALGFAPDGRPRLRRQEERHMVVDVSTDWDRFQALAGEEDDPDAWRRALESVRGRPFSELHQGHWVALEGFGLTVEHEIVDCALRLGRTELRRGDPDAAICAAQLGLRAVPWDERLHRLLMVSSDAAGDRGGVEATIRHLALVMEIDGDPLRAVHPATAELYARLSGKVGAG